MEITNCKFLNNTSENGGGIYIGQVDDFIVANSHFESNKVLAHSHADGDEINYDEFD